jgi:hypothetical protein
MYLKLSGKLVCVKLKQVHLIMQVHKFGNNRLMMLNPICGLWDAYFMR